LCHSERQRRISHGLCPYSKNCVTLNEVKGLIRIVPVYTETLPCNQEHYCGEDPSSGIRPPLDDNFYCLALLWMTVWYV
ncbi:MAG: hypothetical protein WCS64_03895, partial [Dehalococcoidales bacterium]